ncbi:hypothetical protein DESC_660040 [Desulfosarcina cetonica]|nr:hypothetical protein DESC_660040 [Desulfosarcina cetonica]
MQFRPGRKGPANVPGVRRAANGAVDEMKRVSDGIEHHPGAAKHAGTLADGAREAFFVATHVKGGRALGMDLGLTFFKNGYRGHRNLL